LRSRLLFDAPVEGDEVSVVFYKTAENYNTG